MRVHGMTKWDEGQILIKASDALFECSAELNETQPKLSKMLYHMGCQIGSVFNKFGSHQFGLRGLDECVCMECYETRTAAEKESGG